jgi:hypothetical protein
MKSRSVRTFAVLASAGLIVGAFAASPADAAKKKKKPPVCAPYTPTEWAAEEPINVVTDKHTEEAPLVIEIDAPAGLGSSSGDAPNDEPTELHGAPAHSFLNVQADSALPETGLYATLEYTFPFDYDLWVRGDDGTAVAGSAGFAPGVPFFDGTGSGGHTGQGTENIDGLTTADCTGYLVDIVSATTPGETVTLKLWLGEAAYVPGA